MCLLNIFKDKMWYENELNSLKENNKNLIKEYELLEDKYDVASSELETLKKSITIDPLETYWNDKRPKSNTYSKRMRTVMNSNTLAYIDPRVFFNANDNVVPLVSGDTNDIKAYNALRKVIAMIEYVDDYGQFKESEEWLFPFETLNLGKGDCEDGAILMANIMLNSGIPYWRIRLNAGDVEGGGHCWVTYLRESDNQWVILDWCYWPEAALIGLLYKDAEKYYDIWFSFNTKNIYLDEQFEKETT